MERAVHHKRKRWGSFLLAMAVLFSCVSQFIAIPGSAEGARALPAVSGRTGLDLNGTTEVKGEYVLVWNPGPVAQSTGALTGIEPARALLSGEAPEGMWRDLALSTETGNIRTVRRRDVVDYAEGQTAYFNVQDVTTGGYASKRFKVLKKGGHCYIWGPDPEDTAHPATSDIARALANEFDGAYGKMMNAFGSFLDADGTGKVSLLLYDIPGNNPSGYIGGYFNSGDYAGDPVTQLSMGSEEEDPSSSEASSSEASSSEESSSGTTSSEESSSEASSSEESSSEASSSEESSSETSSSEVSSSETSSNEESSSEASSETAPDETVSTEETVSEEYMALYAPLDGDMAENSQASSSQDVSSGEEMSSSEGSSPETSSSMDSSSQESSSEDASSTESSSQEADREEPEPLRAARASGTGNGMQILHIDTYPSIYSYYTNSAHVENAYSTLVHEFQHMINFSNYYRKKQGNPSARPMDTWLNEAMSMAAEEMIFPGSAVPSRLAYYMRDHSGAISQGKSLLEFDNSLDSYALSCLFSAYLKNQTGGYEIFSKIQDNYISDEGAAIEAALDRTTLDDISFSDVTAAYRAAMAANDSSGIYGFAGDQQLASVGPLLYSQDGGSVTLEPGGAIIIKPTGGVFHPAADRGSQIRFAGIRSVAGGVVIVDKPEENSLAKGETFQLAAQGTPPYTWDSSDTAVATVDNTGLLTTLTEGNTVITLSNGDTTDSFTLTVGPPTVELVEPPAQIVLNGPPVTLQAKTRPAGTAVTWSSSDPTVAEINAAGELTAKALGTVTITAACGAQSVTTDIAVVDQYIFQGLTYDLTQKKIQIIRSIGMEELAQVVNGTLSGIPAEMTPGLESWSVELTTPVELDNHIVIGHSPDKAFKGSFDGKNQLITLESISPNRIDADQKVIGLFGNNAGTIKNVNLLVTGELKVSWMPTTDYGMGAGGITGRNLLGGIISNSAVTVSQRGEIHGTNNVGGVAGDNNGWIEHVTVTISADGKIYASQSPVGGVTGHNLGGGGETAIVDTATVYVGGQISSNDDAGGIVGHAQNYRDGYSKLTGPFDVVISKTGSINGRNSSSTSVGGLYGLSNGTEVEGDIAVRIDGNITTRQGHSGGVFGENRFSGTPKIKVTVGPESTISAGNMRQSGLITGSSGGSFDTSQVNNWVYAVPYDFAYQAFPGSDGKNPQVRRLEYPKQGIPVNVITLDPNQSALNTASTADPNGLFMKRNTLTALSAVNALDDEIIKVDEDTQIVSSVYASQTDYYDFNLMADGFDIVVPAYLGFGGNEPPPAMELDILSGHIEDTEDAAKGNPADTTEQVTIQAKNGRITNWEIKKGGTPYEKSHLTVNPDTTLQKVFTLSDPGIYKITATASPLDGSADVSKTRYVCIGGVPAILIEGDHLTRDVTEQWTNLSEQRTQEARHLDVTVEARATVVESYQVYKQGVPRTLYPDEMLVDTPALKAFSLYETGRYRIEARGVSVPDPAVKYVNIDVDAPEAPTVEPFTGRPASITAVLPEENPVQSPIYGEYKLDGGAFVRADSLVLAIPAGTQKITLRTVDLAGNISQERVIEFQDTLPPDEIVIPPDSGGSGGSGGGSSTDWITLRYLVKEGGTVLGRNYQVIPRYANGTAVRAVPDEGYIFAGWSDGLETEWRRDLRVPDDLWVYALFERKPILTRAPVKTEAPAGFTTSPKAIPKTGDRSPVIPCVTALGCVTLAGGCLWAKKKRKQMSK